MSIYFFGPNNEVITWTQPAGCSNITNLSVYAMFNHRVASGFKDIISCWDYSSDKAWLLAKHATGDQLFWEVAYDGSNNSDFIQDSAHALAAGNWYRVCGRWAGARIETDLYDIVNDTSYNNFNSSISHTSVSGSAADIIVGGQFNDLTSNNFDGNIAWATVWDVTLTNEEVESLTVGGVNPLRVRPLSIKFLAPLFDPSYIDEWGPEHQAGTDVNTVSASIIGHETIQPWMFPRLTPSMKAAAAPPAGDIPIFMHHYKQQMGAN